MPTLSVEEILADTIDAIKINVPGIDKMSTNFKPSSLKLDKEYTAHIAAVPSVTEYVAGSGGYQANATDIRTLLTDVPVVVDQHPKVSLYATHLNAIADDKKEYSKVISNTGFALAKSMMLHVAGKFNGRTISQSSTFTTGNSDYDMLDNIRGDMNGVGANPMGRVGVVNTAVASSIALDTRVLSKDYHGDLQAVNAHRIFRNVAGFEEVMEWPELPTNNGDAIAITAAASGDLVTTASDHGLVVGDRVIFPTLAGGAGLTASSTIYYVKTAPSATTLTVSATDGGDAVDITTNYSSGTIQRVEYLSGMFWEPRAIAIIAGLPDDFDAAAQMFGAPPTYNLYTYTDPASGLTLGGIAEVAQGTLRGYLHITHVYGCSVGRQAITNSAGALTDYAGHRLITL